MANKRIIEQTASTTISNDDWLIKDSPTDGTTKIQASVFKTLMNDGMASDEDLADAIENIAGEYDSEVEYSKDALCFNDGVLYIANADTTGTWDSTKWNATTIADIIANLRIDANDVVDVKVKGDSLVNSSKIAVLDSLTAQGSASGSIASFSDGSTHPMSKLEVAIDPIQDLHGYDNPWAGGAGKNKFKTDFENTTLQGVTITKTSDGRVLTSGVPSTGFAFVIGHIALKAGSYILNGCPSGGGSTTYRLQVTDYPVQYSLGQDDGNGISFTLSEDMEVAVRIQFYTGASTSLEFAPMIRLATETDSTFEPYSNICPISGHTEANVTRCGKNLFDKTKATVGKYINSQGVEITYVLMAHSDYIRVKSNTTYYTNADATGMFFIITLYDENKNFMRRLNNVGPASFNTSTASYVIINTAVGKTSIDDMYVIEGSEAIAYEPYNGQTYNIQFKDGSNPLTVYGGTLDVVSGELKVVPYYDSYNGETLDGEWISDRDVYAVGTTPTIGAQVVNIGATPTTYQLTPTQVNSLLGANNVWADTGDVNEAVYTRDLNTIVNDIISRIEALENA